MIMKQKILLVLALAALVRGQRPFFAGTKPIGYPVITTTEGLGDRFGEVDGTTQRLPIEANGDRELIDRLSKLPIDKQPFWFINWQALEAHRQNPQTYPQKPNPFIDPPPQNTGTNTGNLVNSGSFGSGNLVNNGNAGSSSNRNSESVPNSNSANLNSANLNSASAFSGPGVSSNTPSLANRNSFSASTTAKSTNGNAVFNTASVVELTERFAGIELNRYYENENTNLGSVNSNNTKGHNVNGN